MFEERFLSTNGKTSPLLADKMLNCIESNGKQVIVKSIFDLQPLNLEPKKLVIPDDHPQKEAAMKAALQRYENQLKQKEFEKLKDMQKMTEQND